MEGLVNVLVLVNVFVIVFMLDFILRFVYMYFYSKDGILVGFVESCLVYFNIFDYKKYGLDGELGVKYVY